MNSINVNLATKYIKEITDNNRCITCDQLTELRVRYPCGHTVCDNCVVTAEDCLLCLSPPDISYHVTDGPLSLRVEHVKSLLHTFQDAFKLDVYKRERISNKLKLEKELFPECIQAHSKYHNSRRSSNISTKYKEKMKHLPGQNTPRSNTLKRENTINYVQQWLNKNEMSLRESKINLPRKPFADINGQNMPKIPNKVIKKSMFPSTNHSHFKVFDSDSKRKSNLPLIRKRKSANVMLKGEVINKQAKCEKNESGIVIDDNMLFVSDSQSCCYDKDKMACLAVIEAEKNNLCDKHDSILSKNEYEKFINTTKVISVQSEVYKVPFYQKSSLVNTCNQNNESTNKNKIIQGSKSKNVTITIDNNSYVTTINLMRLENNLRDTKHSVEVQTEDGMKFESTCQSLAKTIDCTISKLEKNELSVPCNTPIATANDKENTSGMFKEIAEMKDNNKNTYQTMKKSKCLIIEESDTDSDSDTDKDSVLEVTAQVHRSETENDCNVLSQLGHGEYEHRKKKSLRGKTPASSDSSDKENYDPNRAKRQKYAKKCYKNKQKIFNLC